MSETQVTPPIRAFEVGDDSQGVPRASMQELARDWATEHG
jgi:hypothetical protein